MPAAIARKMLTISLAEPGALRKRTSEKVPITAMPAPTLSLTSIMTIWTITGISIIESENPLLCLFLKPDAHAITAPSANDTSEHTRYVEVVISDDDE